jgi:hypothetical protein
VYAINPTNIIKVNDTIIAKFTSAGTLGNLLRANNSQRVYKIENGQKLWITSQTALTNNGFTFNQVQVVSVGLVNSLPNGPNIN